MLKAEELGSGLPKTRKLTIKTDGSVVSRRTRQSANSVKKGHVAAVTRNARVTDKIRNCVQAGLHTGTGKRCACGWQS
jgi:hypothetical protein